MLLVENNIILGNSGSGNYQAFKPWHHDSGVERWIVDAINYTHTIDGYTIRVRTQAELEAEPLYQSWLQRAQLALASAQAIANFPTIQSWMRTMTPDQAESWIDANVTTLATAKTAIKHMARLLIILRDFIQIHGNP